MLLDNEHILPNIRVPELTISHRRNDKLNSGRWKPNEHEKFLEAIIVHGNDWKLVQKSIKSRSSTQARSHAQKFLLKLRKKLKIEPDSSNKLAKESIDKIVKDIIDASSFRHNVQVDREKLVKLIMGFSNLLVGKVIAPLNYGDFNHVNNNYYFNNNNLCPDGYFDSSYNGGDLFGKKVFHIEKVYKAERRSSGVYSTTDSLQSNGQYFFDKSNDENCNNENLPKSFQINQISNQSDLLKYLFQNPQNQDPSNPNKNVINIISINICNKNEGENANNSTVPSTFPAGLSNTAVITPIISNLKKANPIVTPNNTRPMIPIQIKESVGLINTAKANVNCKNVSLSKKELINPQNVNLKSASSSATSHNTYEQDFYENSSTPSYFIKNNEEDVIDKFFDWN